MLMVLSVVGALIALAPSCSPVGSGQLPVAAAPTSVQSAVRYAVRYAVLTAKLHSSECVHVDTAVLRGLLVHVAFDSCLGFPGERGGPSEEVRSPALRSLFLTTSAVPGAEVVPVARRRKASRVKNGKQGAYARAAAARARALD